MRWLPYCRFAIVAAVLICLILWLKDHSDLSTQVNSRLSGLLEKLPIHGGTAALNETSVEAAKGFKVDDTLKIDILASTTTSTFPTLSNIASEAVPNLNSTSQTSTTIVAEVAPTSVPAPEDASTDVATEIAELISAQLGQKVVVMGKMKTEDTSWVAAKLPDWKSAIYHVDEKNPHISDDPPFLTTSANKGHEATPYLTYIVDNYDSLPMTMAFIHSHEKGWPKAWHTDAGGYSNARSLRNLNIDFVQRNGYANLRCLHSPGCPAEIQPARQGKGEDHVVEHAFAEAWEYIFQNSDVPEVVATPCCAQFAVSKKQVQERPREFYERARDWVLNTTLEDDKSGRVMEYMWHVMFGMEAVYCPPMNQCYEDVYKKGTFRWGG